MHTGTISEENISQILRGISQRRQTGIISIKMLDNNYQIMFSSGKIVEAIDQSITPIEDIEQRLKLAGYAKQSHDFTNYNTYNEVFLALQNESVGLKPFTEQDFRRLVKHRVLDTLYNLSLEKQAEYTFEMRSYEIDKDFSPSISVGQFLLDSVALETERERFLRLVPNNSKVIRLDSGGLTLTEDENLLYNLIGSGISKSALSANSLLSQYAIQSALLSMHERALIEIENDSQSLNNSKALSGDILSILEDNSERPLVEMEFHPLNHEMKKQVEIASQPEHTLKDDSLEKVIPANDDLPIQESVSDSEIVEEEFLGSRDKVKRLGYLNAKILNSEIVPHCLIFIFLVFSCLAILFLWSDIWAAF
jgi:Domain of unknown function (DUF4388)